MWRLFLILVVLFTNFVVLGQTDSPASKKCPALDVTLSRWVVNVGEILTATATVTDADVKDLKFKWSISGGIILEGQGKSEILAQQLPEHAGQSLTVSVTVEDFPNGCPAISDSATTDIAQKPFGEPVDRYGKLNFHAENARLDNFAIALKNDNNSLAFIAVSFDKQTSEKYRFSRIKRIFNYLTIRFKIDAKRILFAVLENDETTEPWIIPPGADFPYLPEQYKAIKGEDLAKKQTPPKPKSKRKKRS